MTETLKQAALRYAAAGRHVFPCDPDGVLNAKGEPSKAPAVKHGFKEATTDPRQIEAWWSENPNYNIGCVPALSGHLVVDVDGTQGALSLARLQSEHAPLPASLEGVSRSGGRHIWFKGVVPSSASRVGGKGSKIDIRSAGGYVLLPPSRAGGQYRWDTSATIEIVPAPEWLLELSRLSSHTVLKAAGVGEDQLQNVERARKAAQALAARPDRICVEGTNGDWNLYRAAADLGDFGLSEETVFAILADEFNPHCEPPWNLDDASDEEHFRQKVRSGLKNRQNELGALAVPPAQELYAHIEPPIGSSKTGEAEPEESFGKFLTLAELRARPPVSWAIQGLVPSKGLTMWYGPPASSKSFQASDAAMHVATGLSNTWANVLVSQWKVLYIATEDAEDTAQNRIAAWELCHKTNAAPIRIMDEPPLISDTEAWTRFVKKCVAEGFDLVVIDPLADVLGSYNENDSTDMRLVKKALQFLARSIDGSVWVVHHTGKDMTKGPRGSSVFNAGFDSMIAVEMLTDGDAPLVAIEQTKLKRAKKQKPFRMIGQKVGPSIVFRRETQEEAKAAYAKAEADDPLSRSNVAAALKRLNAIGPSNGVTSNVLATELYRGDTAKAKTAAKLLDKLAADKLKGYSIDGSWSMPS